MSDCEVKGYWQQLVDASEWVLYKFADCIIILVALAIVGGLIGFVGFMLGVIFAGGAK